MSAGKCRKMRAISIFIANFARNKKLIKYNYVIIYCR